MRDHHYLKTRTQYYQAVENGTKNFEVRKNDRDFKKYDMVYLQEFAGGELTGREIGPFEIKYFLRGGRFGLAEGYCIFSW